jgi:type III restriction enzyme
VYVVESKGVHLKNEDTDYKRSIFELCNKLGEKKDWRELELEFAKKKFEFQVIFGDEWQNKINKIFEI